MLKVGDKFQREKRFEFEVIEINVNEKYLVFAVSRRAKYLTVKVLQSSEDNFLEAFETHLKSCDVDAYIPVNNATKFEWNNKKVTVKSIKSEGGQWIAFYSINGEPQKEVSAKIKNPNCKFTYSNFQ